MAKSVLHVVPHEPGWAVRREGNERVNSTHQTQKDAIEAARDLAKEQDDIVIHRADGTIRERVTYSGGNGADRGSGSDRDEVRPRDLASVGTRVRWGAVFAGVVVALALYVLLSLLATAVGLSAADSMTPKSVAITAAIISAVIMVAVMFLGGFIASRATVGEQPSEAMTYGVLVWGTISLFLLAGGLGLGMGAFAGLRQVAPNTVATGDAETMKRELNLNDQQAERYAALTRDARSLSDRASAEELAWWTFAAVALSLLSAIGGGLLGAGPEVWVRDNRQRVAAPAVATQPA